MAENDTRLETLEDEIKVLKGEVKRTLVDLRALLMREDSPLAEAGFSRRAPAPEPPAPKKEVTEVVAEVVAPTPIVQPEPAPVAAAAPTPVAAPPGPGPGAPPVAPPTPPAPVPGPGPAPGSFPAAVVPQAAAPPPQAYPAPGPGPGPGAFPASPAFQAPPGPGPDLAGLAEQERRMADQERRIAEQERRMAQRERDMEESSRRESQPQSRKRVEEVEDAEVDDPSPTKSLSKKAKEPKPGRGPEPAPANTAPVTAAPVIEKEYEEYREEDELEPASADLMPDLPGVEVPPVVSSPPSPRHSAAEPVKRIEVRRANADWEQEAPEMELAELDDIKTHPTDTPSPETRGVNVYDEYWELLKETREMPASGETPAGPPLDVNLLSSLVHWTSVAKRRVGEQQLRDILELYIQSRHSRPELQELLLHISTMVEEAPNEPLVGPEQRVDLMFHLHGILTGGLPVVQIRPMQLAQLFVPDHFGGS